MLWDIPMRLYHWLFAGALTTAFISGKNNWFNLHEKIGVTLIGLVVFRFIWGFIGPSPARFTHMAQTLSKLGPYLLKSDEENMRFSGHNPIGVLSVAAFWIVALIMSVSGLFNSDDVFFEGPLYSWRPDWSALASQFHEIGQLLILPLIGLHLGAILWHHVVLKIPLTQRMIYGITEEDIKRPSELQQSLGVVLLTACLSMAWFALLWP